jgi:hypothetical protein
MRLHVQTVFSSPLPGLGLRSAPGCIRSTNWIASSRLDILPALCEPSASRGRTWPGQSPAGKKCSRPLRLELFLARPPMDCPGHGNGPVCLWDELTEN